MSTAIRVTGVSKRFRLYEQRYTSLKERVIHGGRVPYRDFWALKDINLDIEQGKTLGLLGHNGSGKSTLLKCIAGILRPTSGEIATAGRVAALLELGAGFHPELTGRENVYLNASILGLSRKEIDRRFDEIVAFAELDEFIDQQVKYFSSGMYVRLGFAVAVNMDPDILIVDEVLAVGDELFQQKCLDRVKQFQTDGKTILFVTHSADLCRRVSDQVAVMDEGKIVTVADPGTAVRSYREHLLMRQRFEEAKQLEVTLGEETGPEPELVDEQGFWLARPHTPEVERTFRIRIDSIDFSHPGAADHAWLVPGDPLTMRVGYEAAERTDDVVLAVSVFDLQGQLLFGFNTDAHESPLPALEGVGVISVEFRDIPLLDGTYPVTIGLRGRAGGTIYDWHEQRHRFEVLNPGTAEGLVHMPVRVSVTQASSTESQAV
jgi:ABC-2 type transport system ATP-binding protein